MLSPKLLSCCPLVLAKSYLYLSMAFVFFQGLKGPMPRCRALLKKDAQLAAAAPDDGARAQLRECYDRGGSVNELVEMVCRVYGPRNVFGSSVGGAADFSFITYAQLWERVRSLASGTAL